MSEYQALLSLKPYMVIEILMTDFLQSDKLLAIQVTVTMNFKC